MKIFFLQPRKFVCRTWRAHCRTVSPNQLGPVLVNFPGPGPGTFCLRGPVRTHPFSPPQIQLGTPISTAVSNQFPAGVTAGGSVKIFEVDTWGGYSQRINEKWQIGLAGTYEFTEFDFSGMNHFYNPRPWSELHIFGGGIPILYNLSDRWTLTLVPVAQVAGEPGVNWGSAISYGGL